MTYKELFKLVSSPWADVKIIMAIASCGRDHATLIRDSIRKDIIEKGNFLPNSKSIIVPMNLVVEHLNLDIDYISNMAIKEQRISL